MTTELSTNQKRDMDALLYLRGADRWQKRVTLKDGRRAYGIPSRTRDGLYHLTDGTDCTCEDRLRNGARCAHMIAATLYRMERAATEAASAPAATVESLPTHGARCLTDMDAQAALDEIMRTSAGQFRQEEAARRRLITSSPFFADAPVAVRVRPMDRYSVLFPEGED
jgi:hypothetical protein